MFGCSKWQINHEDFIVLNAGKNSLVGDWQEELMSDGSLFSQ